MKTKSLFDKKFNEMNSQEHALLRAYGLLRERMNYYNLGATVADKSRAVAYESASEILKAGINEDWEMLNQFDYYDERKN